MSAKSGIEWTDATWNPTVGCSLMSPGCTNCYAMKQAHRLANNPLLRTNLAYRGITKSSKGGPVWTDVVNVSERAILGPLSWRKPRLVFVNSMSDTFHDAVSESDIARIWAVMALTPQHTYQVLTKRPDRMVKWLLDSGTPEAVETAMNAIRCGSTLPSWPLANVWVGTSVEDQKRADDRVSVIAQAIAVVRFLSVEPLLGPVSLRTAVKKAPAALRKIDWVIVGGESGPRARPMHPGWARTLRDECWAAGISFFFKQVGSWHWDVPAKHAGKARGLTPDGRVVEFGTKGSQPILHGSKKGGGRRLDGRLHEEMPILRQILGARKVAACAKPRGKMLRSPERKSR